jgi:predicted nucleotidyltransferase component of viral defense system
MLQKTTVEKTTFELLVKLMNDPMLDDRFLVGGTALALYLGHRKSVDLDLFAMTSNPKEGLYLHLKDRYGFETPYTVLETRKSFAGYITGIKIDCVNHPYPLIDEPYISEEGIRMVGLKDIAAMKLLAINDNGTRLKDFVDVAFLSTKMTYRTMLQAFEQKYEGSNPISPYKALLWHNDIEFDKTIELVDGIFDWALMQQRFIDMTRNVDKIFKKLPVK